MRYLEDYKIGDPYSLGSYTIAADEIKDFARRYDPQSYHLSEEFGKESSFGSLIASGFQVAAIWMRLYVLTMLVNSAVEGSPGIKDCSWLRPVRPGDLLVGTVTITRVLPSFSRPYCGVHLNQGELVNGKGDLVLKIAHQSLFRKRPT